MNPSVPRPETSTLIEACRQVSDPEFGVSIVDLGLIYDAAVDEAGEARVRMTLTSFYCPAGNLILEGVRQAVLAVPGVTAANVELVWEPLWTPDRLTAAAREQLGWDDAPLLD